MIELGKYNVLKVYHRAKQGLYLGDEEEQDILLPNKYVPEGTEEGDDIPVFVYKDSEDRIIATTLRPKILLHQFACLKVKDVNKYGAFMDWGLEKDLMVPFREQGKKMEVNRWYVVYLYKDSVTDRLVGSSRINRFLEKEDIQLKQGEEVNLLIGESTNMGYKVIINQRYGGVIYRNEIFRKIRIGDKVKGYIKTIREDKKIDVTLQKPGYEHVAPNADHILAKLRENKGFLPLTDKSPPALITDQLEMSKKTFKKAIGGLYKKRLIRIEKDGIYLNK